jgi:3-hydroxyisobutyrate dehydrogenase
MKLGFIGVGNMGGPMCHNLIKHDHQLLVHDLNPEARARFVSLGATEGKSAQDVTAQSEVVFTSLPGPAEITEVVLGSDGIAAGAHAETIYVDLSTNAPSVARELAAQLAERGIPMLDAPVSGGTAGAAAGTIAVMAGGEKEVFDKVEPLFRCIGKNIYHVGGHGAGCVVKLINNMLAFTNLAAANEGLMLGIKAGLDPEILLDVLNASSGQSFILKRFKEAILPRNFEPTFALALAHKDLRLALQLGEETGSPLTLGSVVVNQMRQATAMGHAEEDIVALIRVLEKTMGTEVRSTGKGT